MNKAYIDFGTCIRTILVQNSSLIQYTAVDYSSDSLSYLYSVLNDKKIEQITFCMPAYFSSSLLLNSVALSHEAFSVTSGFFCVSIDDLEKLQHLADSLKIPEVLFTEKRFICNNDGIYVFEHENLYHIYTVKAGKLVECDLQTEELVESVLHDRCTRYGCNHIFNYVNESNVDMLMDTFDNIFTISDDRVLCDLTFMSALSGARKFHADEYFNSRFVNQRIVGADSCDNDIKPFQDAVTETETEDDTGGKKMHKRNTAAKQPGGDDDEYFDSSLVHHSKFRYLVLATVAIMLLANAAVYYLCRNQKNLYDNEYAAFVSKSEELQQTEARYTLLASQAASEAGSSAYKFLQDSKLLKSTDGVVLQSFTIDGAAIVVTVLADSNDKFMDFYDKVGEHYSISNYEEGDSGFNGTEYTLNVML